jgi:hypothetical protein
MESLFGLKVKCRGMIRKMIYIAFCTVMVTLKTWTLAIYVMQWTTTECTYSHRKRQSQKLRLLQLQLYLAYYQQQQLMYWPPPPQQQQCRR